MSAIIGLGIDSVYSLYRRTLLHACCGKIIHLRKLLFQK